MYIGLYVHVTCVKIGSSLEALVQLLSYSWDEGVTGVSVLV